MAVDCGCKWMLVDDVSSIDEGKMFQREVSREWYMIDEHPKEKKHALICTTSVQYTCDSCDRELLPYQANCAIAHNITADRA